MLPVAFRIPGLGFEVPGYGLALMVGFMVSIMWAVRRAERSGGNPDVVLNVGFLALFGGIIGSRTMYVVHYWQDFASRPDVIWAILDVRQGGLEVYGGFITVVVLVLLYLWYAKHSLRWYLDIFAPSAALGMAIGRVGCFLNGCCWGGTADLPWSVRFPFGSGASLQQWTDHEPGAGLPQELVHFAEGGLYADGTAAAPLSRESLRLRDQEIAEAGKHAELKLQAERTADPARKKDLLAQLKALPAPENRALLMQSQMLRHGKTAAELRAIAHQHRAEPVHPTQLYAAVNLGLLALLLNALYWRRTRDGQVILTFLLIEPWTRWVLEMIRADNPVDVGGALTISQFLALGLSAVGLVGLIALRALPRRSPRAVWWEPPPSERKQAQPAR
ncbi:MAG: prolipoprotein diacylglyceryl transferase family protein [Planctomycetota bacterium]